MWSGTTGPGKTSQEVKTPVLESQGYHVIQTIGQGSYASVKSAYSVRHTSTVAIKIVSKRRAPQDYLHKFLPRELQIIKQLHHPHIICFLQSIETTFRVYIIMELAEGGDLVEMIRREGVLDVMRAGKYFHHLIDAVEFCHKQGVAHRDLKCENLLIDSRDNLKVSDFGFARSGLRIDSNTGKCDLSSTFCGSYAYACPEILLGIPYQPTLADIWSTGVILYVMVVGRLPFDDSNLLILLKQVQNCPKIPENRKLPDALQRLICKILTISDRRLSIQGIRNDRWFVSVEPITASVSPDEASSSSSSSSIDIVPRPDRSVSLLETSYATPT